MWVESKKKAEIRKGTAIFIWGYTRSRARSASRCAWLESLQFFAVEIQELMKLSPQKWANYQRGLRAASLIASTL